MSSVSSGCGFARHVMMSFVIVATLVGGLANTATAQKSGAIDQAVISKLADELLASMDTPRTIAVRPFKEGEIPVPVRVSRMINDALINAISKKRNNKHTFVTRDQLTKIYEEASVFKKKDIGELLTEAKADVQLIGNIYPGQKGLQIYYQAFELTGHQIASTDTHFMNLDLNAATALMLEPAISEAVNHLTKDVKEDLKTIRVKGIYYQKTGVQTLFGQYVADKFVEKLRSTVKHLKKMNVWVPITGFRNINLEQTSVEETALATQEGAYILSGVVWDFGEQVEVSFTLTAASDKVASRSVRVNKSSIPKSLLPLAPPPSPVVQTTGLQHPRETIAPRLIDNLGPITVHLSTDRGRDPLYKIGETMQLVVQVSRDAFIFCFNQQADGSLIKIFPNRFHTDAHLPAHSSIFIPNEDMPFKYRFAPPAGVEHIRCFATDKDVTAVLPREVATKDFKPLSISSLDELVPVFWGVPGVSVSQASLVVTVHGQLLAPAPK